MQYLSSVSEINKYLKEIISRDLVLSNLWVKGEISNYKPHYSGHIYFTLKDDKSLLKSIMFRANAATLRFVPDNGIKVIIKGYISVFERDGQYQLYVEEMQPDGIGDLHIAFELLKKKLQDEGLFDTDRKKKLPFLPQSIGVVTSLTGSVIRDIINILSRRFYNVNLKIFPVQVQGESASMQIADAIRKLNQLKCVEVIILARGGGSFEELWAFNEETVAQSIYESLIPVISAVGHETDFTIADFVADMRAPTPSAAAELIMPEKVMLKNMIVNLSSRLGNSIRRRVNISAAKMERFHSSVVFRQPYNRVYQERIRLDALNKYMHKETLSKKEKCKASLQMLAGKLNTLSPLGIMARGYSITKLKSSGSVIKSVSGVNNGDMIEINMVDGSIDCIVNNVDRGERIGKQ